MDIIYGLPIVAILAYALYAARRVARRERQRRKQMRRSRLADASPSVSERSEMRAYDNPTTFMDAVTTTQSTGAHANGSGGRSPKPRRR